MKTSEIAENAKTSVSAIGGYHKATAKTKKAFTARINKVCLCRGRLRQNGPLYLVQLACSRFISAQSFRKAASRRTISGMVTAASLRGNWDPFCDTAAR